MDAVLSLYSFRKISPALALGVRVKTTFVSHSLERAYAYGGVRFVVAILLHFFRLHYGLLRQHVLAGGRGRDTRNRFRFLNAEQFGTILVGRIGRMLSLRTVQEVLASVCSTPTDFHRRGDVSAVRASV